MKKVSPTMLSVVVVIVGDTINVRCDTRQLSATLEALAGQSAAPFEIIVPFHAGVDGIEELKKIYPQTNFLLIDDLKFFKPHSREHHDELRTRGAQVAHGQIIAFLEDHVCPRSDWAAQILEAHTLGYAVVGGAVENGVDAPLNWANYFCDLGKYQNPVPGGASPCASLVNASYKRHALESIETVWRERFNETAVNAALIQRGDTIPLSRNIVVTQRREDLNWRVAVKEFYIWGRSYARTRSRLVGETRRIIYALLSIALPFVLVARMSRRVAWRGKTFQFAKAFPFTLLLTASWSLGELFGYFTAPKGVGKSTRTGALEFGK